MVINNFRNVCKCDKISCNRQVNFRGVMKMEKDTFQKILSLQKTLKIQKINFFQKSQKIKIFSKIY